MDSAGRLIGVNTAIYSPSGASSGIGFAVPVGEVNRVVPQIISKGKVLRPGLGVTLANRSLTGDLGLEGVLVLKVVSGSAAEQAGLRGTSQVGDGLVLGDIILAVNGRKVTDYDSLRDEIERYEVGASVLLTLLRDEATAEVSVQLEAMQ